MVAVPATFTSSWLTVTRGLLEVRFGCAIREPVTTTSATSGAEAAAEDQVKGQQASLDAFVADLESRLRAMATAHRLLTDSRWHGVQLDALVAEELRAYGDGTSTGRICAGGPALTLRPQVALALSLALHELATNAAKHGALSVPEGRLTVAWQLTDSGLVLSWQESGGPLVQAPRQRGFGLTLIDRSLAHELGAASSLEFAPGGLRCTVAVPSESLAG